MRWAVVALWMAVIFFFSSQTGGESAGLSSQVVELIAPMLNVEPDTLSVVARKGAHLSEYAVLGGLLVWALRGRPLVAVLIGTAYAATDEFHQTFVPGRAGQVSDVLIDAVGVTLGVLVVSWFARTR